MEELPEGPHLNIERPKEIAGTEWITGRGSGAQPDCP